MIAGAADREVQAEAGDTAFEVLTLLISKLIVMSFFTDTVCGVSPAAQQHFESPFVCILGVL